jgi:hypothetical protein
MISFMRGVRTPVSTTAILADVGIASNVAGYFASRPRIQEAGSAAGVGEVHGEVAGRLGDPG